MANIWARARDLLRRQEGRSPDSPAPGPAASFRGPQPSAAGHNDFALSLYGQLRRRPGNLFFSPYGLGTALAMAYAGARGETAAEMRDSLRLGGAGEDPHASLAGLARRLNSVGGCEVAAA